jgi:signal transduction histidine kinase
MVRVAGICVVTPETPAPPSGLLQPRFFQVLLRSPSDLVVLEPPAWWTAERITWTASGIAAVLLLAVAGVMVTARRRLRDQAARRATAEAEFSAILAERNRMAREIHDTLAQGLGAISMQLELAKDKVPPQANGLGSHLETAHQLVRSSLAEARRSIWNMRSQVLETGDLAKALEGILLQLAHDTGIHARMKVSGLKRRLSAVAENNILRIGQEAIINAFKHSGAERIDVALDFLDGSIRLRVTDDGRGFDPNETRIQDDSFGLTTMRERAALMHGELRLKTGVGQGTTITLEVPMPVEERTKG